MSVEKQVRDLCVQPFATQHVDRSLCPQVRSMSAQMWFARRQLLTALFTSWKHATQFDKLHKLIRKP